MIERDTSQLRIVTVIGARPQFVKAAVVSRELAADPQIEEVIVHTGQHFDTQMSDVFFDELGLPRPKHNLGVASAGHGVMTGAMLEALEPLLECLDPDWVIVHGDTNSTLAGALSAAKLHIPVAHVEAGLRSFNRRMPEEINRILVDHMSAVLFCPTDTAVANLQREGIGPERTRYIGDVMFDAVRIFSQHCDGDRKLLDKLEITQNQYVLSTIHRAENTDCPLRLRAILEGLELVANSMPVVLPLHPRTRQALVRSGFETRAIRIIEPVGYLDMLQLQRHACVIATDSGGVQKEAYFHSVPCVTMRDETEWTELVELGWNTLAPPGRSNLAEEIHAAVGRHGRTAAPYGDGHAAQRIREILVDQHTATRQWPQ